MFKDPYINKQVAINNVFKEKGLLKDIFRHKNWFLRVVLWYADALSLRAEFAKWKKAYLIRHHLECVLFYGRIEH